MLVSFPLLGIFQVLVFLPIIPELIERLVVDLRIEEGRNEYVDTKLNDKCNDAYGLMFSLIMFLGPLIDVSYPHLTLPQINSV